MLSALTQEESPTEIEGRTSASRSRCLMLFLAPVVGLPDHCVRVFHILSAGICELSTISSTLAKMSFRLK